MGSDRYGEVQALARDVQGLLRRLDPKSLQLKPNSYEPTVGESLALALLGLDRIASDERVDLETAPTFATDYLNRRLSKRLLERYRGRDLPAEFERRLADVLRTLAKDGPARENAPALAWIHRFLIDLESVLLQRPGAID